MIRRNQTVRIDRAARVIRIHDGRWDRDGVGVDRLIGVRTADNTVVVDIDRLYVVCILDRIQVIGIL